MNCDATAKLIFVSIIYFMRILFFTIITLVLLSSCSNSKQVDLIVHHAIVYTVDDQFSTAEAFAVSDGKRVHVGFKRETTRRGKP